VIKEDLFSLIAAKQAQALGVGLKPKGILVSNEDYDMLKDEFRKEGINANPDRLMGLPLYTPDPDRVSSRTGQPKEVMVLI